MNAGHEFKVLASFPNFSQFPKIISLLVTREATRMYHVYYL